MVFNEPPRLTNSSNDFTHTTPQGLGFITRDGGKSGNPEAMSNNEDDLDDSEVELPAQRGRPSEVKRTSPTPQPELSSDDFPSIAALSQQSQIVKKERSRSTEAKSGMSNLTKSAKISGQQHSRKPPPASQPRAFQPRLSSPSASQSRPTQSQPVYKSQVVDLTMTSSDVEDEEPEPAAEPSFRSKSKPGQFQMPDEDSDFDNGGGGWIPKSSKNSNGSGKRQPSGSGGYKESSQNRKKSAHR